MGANGKPIVSIATTVNNTPTSFALDDIEIISDHANETLLTVREQMLLPHPKKHPPVFTTPQLAALCRIDRKKVNYYWERAELGLPQGTSMPRSREFYFSTGSRVDQKGRAVHAPPGRRQGQEDSHR